MNSLNKMRVGTTIPKVGRKQNGGKTLNFKINADGDTGTWYIEVKNLHKIMIELYFRRSSFIHQFII